MDLPPCPNCNNSISRMEHHCRQCGFEIRLPRGVDQGFCFSYWDLSYRRKFIRTIWIFLFTPLLLFIPTETEPFGLSMYFWVGFTIILGIIQLCYSYVMWKNLE